MLTWILKKESFGESNSPCSLDFSEIGCLPVIETVSGFYRVISGVLGCSERFLLMLEGFEETYCVFGTLISTTVVRSNAYYQNLTQLSRNILTEVGVGTFSNTLFKTPKLLVFYGFQSKSIQIS